MPWQDAGAWLPAQVTSGHLLARLQATAGPESAWLDCNRVSRAARRSLERPLSSKIRETMAGRWCSEPGTRGARAAATRVVQQCRLWSGASVQGQWCNASLDNCTKRPWGRHRCCGAALCLPPTCCRTHHLACDTLSLKKMLQMPCGNNQRGSRAANAREYMKMRGAPKERPAESPVLTSCKKRGRPGKSDSSTQACTASGKERNQRHAQGH